MSGENIQKININIVLQTPANFGLVYAIAVLAGKMNR